MTLASCHNTKTADFETRIVSNDALSEKTYWMTVECPELAEGAFPGASVMVFPSGSSDPFLGRPFAVADADPKTGYISLCYVIVGRGTKMMTGMNIGEKVRLRGPFGVPLPQVDGRIYIASGGVGIATYTYFAKIYREKVADIFWGVPGKGYERFVVHVSKLLPGIRAFADDGTFGEGSSMFSLLPKPLGDDGIVWSSGPAGFLKALKGYYEDERHGLYFSPDRRMACGYGGCMGCVVMTLDGPKRLCADRSLFRSDEVTDDEI